MKTKVIILKILIIIANYLPQQNPNILRWEAIGRHWVEKGHELFILTTKHSERESYEKERGINVFRTGEASLLDFYYNKIRAKKRRNDFEHNSGEKRPSKFRKVIEKIIDLSWRKIYWPDGARLFLNPGKKLAKKIIQKNEIDVVISIGLPFTCHLIARHVKTICPHSKWIMDIQDPFCYSKEFWVNNFALYEQKNIQEEKKAFALADHVVLTNSEAKDKYSELFPEHAKKLSCIPPLFKEEALPSGVSPIQFDKNRVNLVYAGSFYENVRSPKTFLKFISQISKMEPSWLKNKRFHFIGQFDHKTLTEFYQFKHLFKYIILHGPIKHADLFKTMKQADFLLHFGNTTSYHLPSKSVEYLALGKPVVNIISTERDSFKLFIKNSLAIVHLNLQEKDKHFEKLKEFVSNNIEYSLPPESIEALLEPYTLEKIAERYFQLMSVEANNESRAS